MKNTPAIIILGIFFLFLSFGNLYADSSFDTENKTTSTPANGGNALHLARADTSTIPEDLNRETSDDMFMDDLEDLDEPYVTLADPLEPINRIFFHFNDKLYYWVIKPAAKGYGAVVPEPIRIGFKNFFKNLSFPVRFVNCILQWKFEGAGYEVERFFINSTLGLAGFMDRASVQFEIPEYDEDLGQTLGSYGIGHGFFINWPILGPRTVTDTVGYIGDAFLEPLNYIDVKTKYDLSIKAFEQVNETSLSQPYEDVTKAALDPYVALKDAYYQNRQSQIKK